VTVSSKFDLRSDPAVVRNYGNLLTEVAAVVPDGVVCFFTSYAYMEAIVQMWHDMKIIEALLRRKLLFVETPDARESALALENYRRACDSGRGGVFFCVARGKVSLPLPLLF
jgi:DNA excision repair protein ERCC-2